MANTTGKKYGGRQKGTENKVTKVTRDTLQSVVSDYFNSASFADDLEALQADERIKVYTGLLPYILPKIKQESNEYDKDVWGN